jgi:D-alanyl-D-alanine carboxypeptidase
VVAPSVKPEARPTDLVLASVQSSVQPRAAVQPREVVTRLSTSGGKHWGINVGRFNSRYQAERALLKTALNEMETLDGSLRSVVKRPKGFEANFNGLTRERAETACRRLQARNVTCFMMGPG